MKTWLFFLSMSFLMSDSYAQPVVEIHASSDYSKYSKSELRRRVYDLERAVWQLQQKVYELDRKQSNNGGGDQWICVVETMGNKYTGLGGSRAVATHRAIENCKRERGGDGFFCKTPKCQK